jgi:sec-independent protein translocase protein TatA
MGPIGTQEMVFIFVLALILLGPKKLPELGRTFGKWMMEFRRASSELKATFEREMSAIERETQSIKEETHKYTNEIYNYDSYYDSGSYGDGSHELTAGDSTHVSASAPQGAESTVSTTLEGTEAASHYESPDGNSFESPAASSHPEPARVAENGSGHEAMESQSDPKSGEAVKS